MDISAMSAMLHNSLEDFHLLPFVPELKRHECSAAPVLCGCRHLR
jgi:hypothetical protein